MEKEEKQKRQRVTLAFKSIFFIFYNKLHFLSTLNMQAQTAEKANAYNAPDKGSTGGGGGENVDTMLDFNSLQYEMYPDLSVAVERSYKYQYFQLNEYVVRNSSAIEAICVFNTGSDFIDGRNSYFVFELQQKFENIATADYTPAVNGLGNSLAPVYSPANVNAFPRGWIFGPHGSAFNLIRRVIIEDRAGNELERVEDTNVLVANLLKWMQSDKWLKKYGFLFRYGHCDYNCFRNRAGVDFPGFFTALDGNSTIQIAESNNWARMVLPLRFFSGLFDYDQLLPSQLMGGLRLRITFETDLNKCFVWVNGANTINGALRPGVAYNPSQGSDLIYAPSYNPSSRMDQITFDQAPQSLVQEAAQWQVLDKVQLGFAANAQISYTAANKMVTIAVAGATDIISARYFQVGDLIFVGEAGDPAFQGVVVAIDNRPSNNALGNNEIRFIISMTYDRSANIDRAAANRTLVRHRICSKHPLQVLPDVARISNYSYVISRPRIVVDSVRLSDSIQRELNERSANDGLEICYRTWWSNSFSFNNISEINAETRKAVSRCFQAFGRLTRRSGTSSEEQGRDSMGCYPVSNAKEFQWRCGNLYFPNQKLAQNNTGDQLVLEAFMHANRMFGKGKETWWENSIGYEDLLHAPHMLIYPVDLERTTVQDLSGLPLNNSRVLNLNLVMNNTDNYDLIIYMQYLRIARVFLDNTEIEE